MLTKVTIAIIIAFMLKKDAVKFYGCEARLAKALGIHRSAVLRWRKWVPLPRAVQLEKMSGGHLKYNLDDYVGRL